MGKEGQPLSHFGSPDCLKSPPPSRNPTKTYALTIHHNPPHPQLPHHLVKRSLPDQKLLTRVREPVQRRSSDHVDVSLPHDRGLPILPREVVRGDEESKPTDADEDPCDLGPAELDLHEEPAEEHARGDGPGVEEHAGKEVGVLRKGG